MNIYDYITKDHRTAEALFEQTLAATDPAQCKRSFEELKYELLAHAVTEDATFYEALRQNRETAEDIREAKKEHDEMAELLSELSNHEEFGGEAWMAQLTELQGAVMHHVEEEEGEIFDEARNVLSDEQAERLAAAMETMKRRPDLKIAA